MASAFSGDMTTDSTMTPFASPVCISPEVRYSCIKSTTPTSSTERGMMSFCLSTTATRWPSTTSSTTEA